VKVALSIGANNFILETDAQQAVWALRGDDFRLAVVGGIVHELKDLVAESSGSIATKYAPRDCNRVIGSKSNDLAPMVFARVSSCICFWCRTI